MSKKTTYIIISIIIFTGIMVGVFFILNKQNKVGTVSVVENEYPNFNPFGSSDNIQTNENLNENKEVKQTNDFYQITNFGIAGLTIYQEKKILSTPKITETKDIKTGKIIKNEINYEYIPTLRYVQKSNGHIYDTEITNKNSKKISNTTIPGVQEAFFNKDANTVIYRYLSFDNKNIESFIATLGNTHGEFLPENIQNVVLNKDKNKFFILLKNKTGSVGYSRSFEPSIKSEIFSSSFSEWIPQWVSDENIYLTTKASYSFKGGLFNFNTKNKTITKIIDNIPGLTTLISIDGSKVVYSEYSNSGLKLNIFNIKEKSIIDLDTKGLPEKCVWGKNNSTLFCAIPNNINYDNLPDLWYQGLVSFSDRFVKINTTNGEVEDIINSSSVTPVDAINLVLDDTESKLFFINKKDSTLWGLNLN